MIYLEQILLGSFSASSKETVDQSRLIFKFQDGTFYHRALKASLFPFNGLQEAQFTPS